MLHLSTGTHRMCTQNRNIVHTYTLLHTYNISLYAYLYKDVTPFLVTPFLDLSQFWFAGDTGYCSAFKKIGERHGPIDLSAIPIGAYSPRSLFRRVHMNPEEALLTHLDVKSAMSIAMHHSTFQVSGRVGYSMKQVSDRVGYSMKQSI